MTIMRRFLITLMMGLFLQLGNSPAAPITQISVGSDYISSGYFLKADGSLWRVGYINSIAYLNTNNTLFATNIAAVATNPRNDHTLLLKTDGSLWAFGENGFGQLGDGTTGTSTTVPEEILSSNVIAIAVGESHSVFIKTDGSLWAMGYNAYGQLGDGSTTSRSKPERIVASNVVAVAAGVYHT
ncbi:MAG: RCC1 domain-containing protein, partial [Limisphaerales bacterium]